MNAPKKLNIHELNSNELTDIMEDALRKVNDGKIPLLGKMIFKWMRIYHDPEQPSYKKLFATIFCLVPYLARNTMREIFHGHSVLGEAPPDFN